MATNRIAKLRQRRTDPLIKSAVPFEFALEDIREEEPVKYVVETMRPIDEEYTRNTFVEGDRVKSQLDKILNFSYRRVEFRYQGSVTNDTHVRVHSDLDLLVINRAFEWVEPPGIPAFPYQGKPFDELKQLRSDATSTLKSAFPAVFVNDKSPKCIALSGGSLRREIDVVIASWWNTIEYQRLAHETLRGVKVLNAETGLTFDNKPFLHNGRIHEADQKVGGNLRRAIRFLKSLKYDADIEIKMSSYDIASLAWNMRPDELTVAVDHEVALVASVRQFVRRVYLDDTFRKSIYVPNGMRKIFCDEGTQDAAFARLVGEVEEIAKQIEAALADSYRNIGTASTRYS